MNGNEPCPKCNSSRTEYDDYFGFWECDDCGNCWGNDEDDPDYDEEPVDMGTCCGCGCGCTGNVQNIIMLNKKAPVPGTGWGCMVCGLPSDGAIAIICDNCLAQMDSQPNLIKEVVYGYATDKQRYSLNGLTEEFKHRDIPH